MISKTVVLAEDERITRDAVRAILSHDPFLEVVGEAGNAADAIRMVHRHRPVLLVLDLSLPGIGGLEVIRTVREELPETLILVLTVHESDDYVYDAMTAGAHGYCVKDADAEELLTAVKRVLEGKRYLSRGVSGKVLTDGGGTRSAVRGQSSLQRLTRRERQILKMVAEGNTNKQIAECLTISFKTVEKHRSNLMTKLGLHTAARLTAYAIDRGIIRTSAATSIEPAP